MTTAAPPRPPARRRAGRPQQPADPRSVHEKVADRIIALLDQGGLPPWEAGFQAAVLGPNRNAVSGAPYRGINFLLTGMTLNQRGYHDPRWLTFNQAKALGGSVKRGEKGTNIVFWKTLNHEDDAEAEAAAPGRRRRGSIPMARQYTVFNAEQTEGCALKPLDPPELYGHDPIEAAERIVREMPDPPPIIVSAVFAGSPRYQPDTDRIDVPDLGLYRRPERYYCALFHELVHSTGHPKRLNRLTEEHRSDRGLHAYGKEELVAGLGSAMLSALAGIAEANEVNDAVYLRGWRDAINADKTMVIRAAGLAQRAVDHIVGQAVPADTPDEPAA